MAACSTGYTEFVEELLKIGADLNIKSCNEQTCLDWAKRLSKNEIIELIECYKLDAYLK